MGQQRLEKFSDLPKALKQARERVRSPDSWLGGPISLILGAPSPDHLPEYKRRVTFYVHFRASSMH